MTTISELAPILDHSIAAWSAHRADRDDESAIDAALEASHAAARGILVQSPETYADLTIWLRAFGWEAAGGLCEPGPELEAASKALLDHFAGSRRPT